MHILKIKIMYKNKPILIAILITHITEVAYARSSINCNQKSKYDVLVFGSFYEEVINAKTTLQVQGSSWCLPVMLTFM